MASSILQGTRAKAKTLIKRRRVTLQVPSDDEGPRGIRAMPGRRKGLQGNKIASVGLQHTKAIKEVEIRQRVAKRARLLKLYTPKSGSLTKYLLQDVSNGASSTNT